jgi:alcohol dehydrogenase class IV
MKYKLTSNQHEHGRRQEIIVRAMGSEPRVALLDGNLLVSAPRQPLLDAGLDAICHACESLWARNSSLITDALAEKALETFLDRFPAALNDRDPEALQDIIEASSAANLACGNTGLALCHAMNTAPDVPLAHGYVNGCILSAVAAFNRPYMRERHQKLIDRLPAVLEKVRFGGKFKQGECSEKNTELFVNASRDHPFRKNNIREASGKTPPVIQAFVLISIPDADCYELLRQSGAVVASAA